MLYLEDEVLDDEYARYLDENCKCTAIDETCTCLKFDEWFNSKLEEYYECFEDII